MYDLFLAGILLSAAHLAVAYVTIEVLRLEYKMYLAASVTIGLIMAWLLKAMMFVWKEKVTAVIAEENREHVLLPDVLLFFGALVVGGLASSLIVYRRFGAAGWAGGLAANWMASWLV
jgi:hypothetical protein